MDNNLFVYMTGWLLVFIYRYRHLQQCLSVSLLPDLMIDEEPYSYNNLTGKTPGNGKVSGNLILGVAIGL